MSNLATLLDDWRVAIDLESKQAKNSRLLLTMISKNTPWIEDWTYPIESMKENLDWLHVFAFDYYEPWSTNNTSPFAALYDPNSDLNTDYGINAWIKYGFPSQKIILGLPFYGCVWTLAFCIRYSQRSFDVGLPYYVAKNWWNFRTGNSLLKSFLEAKYCKRLHPVARKGRPDQSHTWRRLMNIKDKCETHMIWKIGKGNLSFWWNNWSGKGSIAKHLHLVHKSKNTKVAEFIREGKWDESHLRLELPANIVDDIMKIQIHKDQYDKIISGYKAYGANSKQAVSLPQFQGKLAGDMVVRKVTGERQQVGEFLRDYQGNMRMAFHAYLGVCSNNMAEGLAIMKGLQWCATNHFHNVIVESDSMIMVNMIRVPKNKLEAKTMKKKEVKETRTLQVFSFDEMKEATNNFSVENELGKGGYGPVYKGKLRNGKEIAVKRLSETSSQGLEEFENEVIRVYQAVQQVLQAVQQVHDHSHVAKLGSYKNSKICSCK
ncbi:hypothetical protein T459_18905 [Capsicum annuum]|uniref:Uncharacterized protein n=1 Tax=Capsicum annuum TaxID=4072 RepID=A0A2G2Z079_CAPAN|nr:hypothetical protein T459_18905 [Capsicum annuum]